MRGALSRPRLAGRSRRTHALAFFQAGGALLGRSKAQLCELVQTLGEPTFRAKQLHDHLYNPSARVSSLEEATSLPKSLRRKLLEHNFSIGRLHTEGIAKSKDGTQKLLLKLQDSGGNVVETVGIPTSKRLTACISSQVGCALACHFCSTGKGGFTRSLSQSEILAQILEVEHLFGRRVSNIVMMGQGEPLMNSRNTIPAIQRMNEDFGIGARSLCVSTVGVPGGIDRLASVNLQLTLAVSLHCATQSAREELIPSAKNYPLEQLMRDCRDYLERTNRRLSFEVTLIKNVNSNREHAVQLAELLRREIGQKWAHVNLIPWNSFIDASYESPTEAEVSAFERELQQRGMHATIRKTRGADASAACGQLRNEQRVR